MTEPRTRPRRYRVGDASIRRRKGGDAYRVVKWREPDVARGITGDMCWMSYARWWWLTNRGPIPEGKRVIHVDGDPLNDSPDNLALGTAADAFAVVAFADPERDERGRQNQRAATAEHNRLRARVRRALGFAADRWYPVALEAGQIYNAPRRHVWHAMRDAGMPIDARRWRRWRAISLGWSTWPLTESLILAALLDAADGRQDVSVTGATIRRRIAALCELRSWQPPQRTATFYSAVSRLAAAGMIDVTRGGRRPSRYAATQWAIERRIRGERITPLRGADLERPPIAGYRVIDVEEPTSHARWGGAFRVLGPRRAGRHADDPATRLARAIATTDQEDAA